MSSVQSLASRHKTLLKLIVCNLELSIAESLRFKLYKLQMYVWSPCTFYFPVNFSMNPFSYSVSVNKVFIALIYPKFQMHFLCFIPEDRVKVIIWSKHCSISHEIEHFTFLHGKKNFIMLTLFPPEWLRSPSEANQCGACAPFQWKVYHLLN